MGHYSLEGAVVATSDWQKSAGWGTELGRQPPYLLYFLRPADVSWSTYLGSYAWLLVVLVWAPWWLKWEGLRIRTKVRGRDRGLVRARGLGR